MSFGMKTNETSDVLLEEKQEGHPLNSARFNFIF